MSKSKLWMEVPKSITKREYTSLNKKNAKWLNGEITDAIGDVKLEAEWVIGNTECDPLVDGVDGGIKDTVDAWAKDVKVSFKDFIKCRNAILKSYIKGGGKV